MAGGLVLALLSPFFDWVTISAKGFGSASGGPMDDGARFRVGDWLGMDSVDGYLVLVVAAAGLAAIALQRAGRVQSPWAQYLPMVPAAAGAVLAALGALNWQYITSKSVEGADVSAAIGLYLLILGGVAAGASRFIPATPVNLGTKR